MNVATDSVKRTCSVGIGGTAKEAVIRHSQKVPNRLHQQRDTRLAV